MEQERNPIRNREEVETWIEEKLPDMIRDLRRICRIPSVAVIPEDKKPPFGDACVQVLNEMLQIGQEYGFETDNYDQCVGRIRYGSGSGSVGIWSHLDVVPTGENWVYPPYELTEKDGYVIARGSNDNKSSAIVALYTLLYLKEHGITTNHSYSAYFGTCEEAGMYDLDYFIENYSCPDLSMVPDSGFPVCCGERGAFNGELTASQETEGRLLELNCDCGLYTVPDKAVAVVADSPQVQKFLSKWNAASDVTAECLEQGVRITCRGVSTHAAAPKGGVNALTVLAGFLCEQDLVTEQEKTLLGLVIQLNEEGNGASLGIACEDELSGPLVLTVTTAWMKDGCPGFGFISKTPVTCNHIPFAETAKRAAESRGFTLQVTRDSKANFFDPNHPAAQAMTDTYNEITGLSEKPFVMSGGTYARKLPRSFACGTGMPLPKPPQGLFLPGHGDYHQPDESIAVERIKRALLVYICGILRIDQLEI